STIPWRTPPRRESSIVRSPRAMRMHVHFSGWSRTAASTMRWTETGERPGTAGVGEFLPGTGTGPGAWRDDLAPGAGLAVGGGESALRTCFRGSTANRVRRRTAEEEEAWSDSAEARRGVDFGS